MTRCIVRQGRDHHHIQNLDVILETDRGIDLAILPRIGEELWMGDEHLVVTRIIHRPRGAPLLIASPVPEPTAWPHLDAAPTRAPPPAHDD